MRSALLVLVAVVAAELSVEQQQKRAETEAAAAHEARAQKALSDSLTDALAMLKHGSARAKESAAAGIAQLAIETTMCAARPTGSHAVCVPLGRHALRASKSMRTNSSPNTALHPPTRLTRWTRCAFARAARSHSTR